MVEQRTSHPTFNLLYLQRKEKKLYDYFSYNNFIHTLHYNYQLLSKLIN